MNEEYKLVERTPTIAEYNSTRRVARLTVKNEVAAERGLSGTLYAVCVLRNEDIVGIGRVIGDGGLFFDIVDVAVAAGHQKKGGRQNDNGRSNELLGRSLTGYFRHLFDGE